MLVHVQILAQDKHEKRKLNLYNCEKAARQTVFTFKVNTDLLQCHAEMLNWGRSFRNLTGRCLFQELYDVDHKND